MKGILDKNDSCLSRPLINDIGAPSGEYLYRCNVCTKTFTQGGSLKYHMRIHSGEKLYCCNYCKILFTQYGNLKIQLKTHSGEKNVQMQTMYKVF